MKRHNIPIVTFCGNRLGSPLYGIYFKDHLKTSIGLAQELIGNTKGECKVVFTINTSKELLCAHMIYGKDGHGMIQVQDIIRTSIVSYASALSGIILVCKHPLNDMTFNEDDMQLAYGLARAVRYVDMFFWDYIIFGDEDPYLSMSEKGMLPDYRKIDLEIQRGTGFSE